MAFFKWPFKKRKVESFARNATLKLVPNHVAIIMDGNGRWANSRGLPRFAGHKEGMDNVKRIVKVANAQGIKVLTMYAFSTENWRRPKQEVDYLMKLPKEFLNIYLPELIEENVQVKMIGHRAQLPAHTQAAVEQAIEQTKHNNGLILNLALNYGSRAEIIAAIKAVAGDVSANNINIDDIDEATINKHLFTTDLPDPDLLIRTSGEMRVSNFLLWQLAYTEFWFTDVHWPAFTEAEFVKALDAYQQRKRRYGGL
ncbi:undecaprenyl diphosphate synthase [Amphibacillus marinus]|uniref:Isoprenyl transferase n=1 Tax=Amphibacillus marinus TaxID=872970 RepID=A0A1H8HN57_9BACI|nr:isoprenyl transferase [Amphibacillus marinus]SEN57549.1 undecaprenyl diphosphate synthase [Amphibacillus marinus]